MGVSPPCRVTWRFIWRTFKSQIAESWPGVGSGECFTRRADAQPLAKAAACAARHGGQADLYKDRLTSHTIITKKEALEIPRPPDRHCTKNALPAIRREEQISLRRIPFGLLVESPPFSHQLDRHFLHNRKTSNTSGSTTVNHNNFFSSIPPGKRRRLNQRSREM